MRRAQLLVLLVKQWPQPMFPDMLTVQLSMLDKLSLGRLIRLKPRRRSPRNETGNFSTCSIWQTVTHLDLRPP